MTLSFRRGAAIATALLVMFGAGIFAAQAAEPRTNTSFAAEPRAHADRAHVQVAQASGAAAPAPPAPAEGAAAPAASPGASPAAAPAAAPAPVAPAVPLPPNPAIVAYREKLEANRSALDALEAALSVEGLRSNDLDDLRSRLDPIRKDLSARADDLAPRVKEATTRLAELGPKPAANGTPEEPNVTADRDRMQALANELDGVMKQNRALTVRADQISDRISSRRRALFTGQLFERSDSVLAPTLWTGALAGVSAELRSLQFLLSDWSAYAAQRQSPLVLFALAVAVVAAFGLVFVGGRGLRRLLRTRAPEDGAPLPRLRAAREAIKVAFIRAGLAPLVAVGVVSLLDGFDVVPPRAQEIIHGLVVAIFIEAIGHGLGRALLAPNEPWRRLPALSDRTATLVYRYYSWAIWALAIGAFLNFLHKSLFAPLSVTVATSAIMALLMGGFLARLLINLAKQADQDEAATLAAGAEAEGEVSAPGSASVRFFAWLALTGMTAALVIGYVSFAAFVAARMVIAAGVFCGLYVLYALIDSFFSEGLAADTPRARALSKTLGLSHTRIELIGTLLAGLLKVVLFIVAGLIIVGSLGTSTADVMDSVERASFGVQIGNTSITLWSVLYALALLLVGIVLARGLQGWLSSQVLPRTGLEPSLQSSIATIVGYLGVILAIMVPMGQLGLNLESIALVAGALSVGIGFGLQSIVSNFVSGLILLAERPIRVGDTINVKGEEGYVRRISVRSTEIETFDRAAVIVPNSDLITGMVKNFTHANTTGRVIVAVNVAFDADPEEVRDILVACACDHPQVMETPPPRVFLIRFSETGMNFELRCVVANVDYSLTVRSDLHFALLSRFRAAGIGIVAQPWAALGRAPADMVPPPGGGAGGGGD